MATIDSLPNEVLIQMMRHSSPEIWYLVFRKVCTRWSGIVAKMCERIRSISYDRIGDYEIQIVDKTWTITPDGLKSSIDDFNPFCHYLIENSGPNLTRFIMHNITSFALKRICQEMLRCLAINCPGLNSFSIDGDNAISTISISDGFQYIPRNLRKLTFCCPDPLDTEEVVPPTRGTDDQSNLDRKKLKSEEKCPCPFNSATFFEKLILGNEKLECLDLELPYIGFPERNVLRFLINMRLRKLFLRLKGPYESRFINFLLDVVSQSAQNLSHLKFSAVTKGPLNNGRLWHSLVRLASIQKIRVLDVCFELYNDQEDDTVEWDFDESPWSSTFFDCLERFTSLKQLKLENFDLRPRRGLALQAAYLRNLDELTLRDCRNFKAFLRRSFPVDLPLLHSLDLDIDGTLPVEILSEFICMCCPRLRHLMIFFSKNDGMKDFILRLHGTLHNCTAHASDERFTECLIVTSCSSLTFYDELPRHLCGLTVSKKHARVKIDRLCKRLHKS